MMRYPNKYMLTSIAMGDAYGFGCEYIELPKFQSVLDLCLDFFGYVQHPTFAHPAGFYTDDTEMSVANAHVLLEEQPPYFPVMFANAYVAEFKYGGHRNGYSRGLQTILESSKSGAELMVSVRPSNKNGAAMRAVPLGVLPTVDLVLNAATIQAKVTHDTPEGRFSARAVALMSHFALYNAAPLTEVGQYCLDNLPPEDKDYFDMFLRPWKGRVIGTKTKSVALTTVHAVKHMLIHGTSLRNIMERTLDFGGDTDSVAAISWGIASARFQNERLSSFWARDLEGGSAKTGVAYLEKIGYSLMEKFNR